MAERPLSSGAAPAAAKARVSKGEGMRGTSEQPKLRPKSAQDGKAKACKATSGRSREADKENNGRNRPLAKSRRPAGSKVSFARAGKSVADGATEATKAADHKKPKRTSAPPPAMTASFVMGVQRRPSVMTRSQRAPGAAAARAIHAQLQDEASRVPAAAAWVEETASAVAAAVTAARAVAGKPLPEPKRGGDKGKAGRTGKLQGQALRVAARLALANASHRQARLQVARCESAKGRLDTYTAAWKSLVRGSWNDWTLLLR